MSNSLINSAMSGLSAAQNALSTTSNNISNYNVAGYSRQTTVLDQASSTLSNGNWVGNGVTVSGIRREYDAFITNQLRDAQNQSTGLTSRYQQIAQVDNLLSSSTSSISTALQGFFASVTTLASNAGDAAARQAFLGQAAGLANQFKVTDQYLQNMDKQVNGTVASSVSQINTYTAQIANLNQQIAKMTAIGGGALPNNLLDQRDQLINQLNQVVGVQVSVQDGNTLNISMANGMPLVQGSRSTELAAVPSKADPSRTTVAYVDQQAGNVEIPEKLITSGTLGGVLASRSQDLDSVRNQLGQLAVAFTAAVNKVHGEGFDLNGDEGKPVFSVGVPYTTPNGRNTGSGSISATLTNGAAVQATNYSMSYDSGNWTVTRQPAGTTVSGITQDTSVTPPTLSFEGLTIAVNGSPNNGDSFLVKPVVNAVAGMGVLITDPAELALAGAAGAGESDNRNAQALLSLQTAPTVGGNKSFNDTYASLVADVGNKTSNLKTTSTTQANVVTQLSNQQQSVSGVNLDEEYGNLQRYQQYYMANAQVLQTASSLFDALLSIRGAG